MPNRILRDCTDSVAVNSLTAQAEIMFYRLIMKVDDYGRYVADAKLLRSYLYPLQEKRCADISRLLIELEQAGLITAYKVDGKDYLEIVNFRQVLRTKKSKYPQNAENLHSNCIADATQMTSNCTASAYPETETETEKKRVTNVTPKAKVNFSFVDMIPASLKTNEFVEKWEEWEVVRAKKHRRLSTISAREQLAFLEKYPVDKAIEMLTLSIRNDWTGVFEVKERQNNAQKEVKSKTSASNLASREEEKRYTNGY